VVFGLFHGNVRLRRLLIFIDTPAEFVEVANDEILCLLCKIFTILSIKSINNNRIIKLSFEDDLNFQNIMSNFTTN
jgi:hypothetical protein